MGRLLLVARNDDMFGLDPERTFALRTCHDLADDRRGLEYIAAIARLSEIRAFYLDRHTASFLFIR
jgi:hypothetical protein